MNSRRANNTGNIVILLLRQVLINWACSHANIAIICRAPSDCSWTRGYCEHFWRSLLGTLLRLENRDCHRLDFLISLLQVLELFDLCSVIQNWLLVGEILPSRSCTVITSKQLILLFNFFSEHKDQSENDPIDPYLVRNYCLLVSSIHLLVDLNSFRVNSGLQTPIERFLVCMIYAVRDLLISPFLNIRASQFCQFAVALIHTYWTSYSSIVDSQDIGFNGKKYHLSKERTM